VVFRIIACLMMFIFRNKFGLCVHCLLYTLQFLEREHILLNQSQRHLNTTLNILCLITNRWNTPKNAYLNRTGTNTIFNWRRPNLQRLCHSPSLCYNFLYSYTNSNWCVWKLISTFSTKEHQTYYSHK
jgi:hypothetical protein